MVRYNQPGSLGDLISEYNLMKDVEHENVIRLVGACTDKRGPFCIILEYAEHGSMRYSTLVEISFFKIVCFQGIIYGRPREAMLRSHLQI